MDQLGLAHWRLHTVRLSGQRLGSPEAVVEWLGAVQSQDYGPAKWSIGERVSGGGDDAAMDKLFAAGAFLRTHVLRPTWHFVLPADIRWMLELTAPRVHAFNAYYYRQQELDHALLERCADLIAESLSGGRQLTRKQIAAELAAAGIAAANLRLGLILMYAELRGTICSGALNGKQHTWALLDERAPGATTLDRDAALETLVLRYFTSHGPATVKDFQWWSSLTAAEAKKGLALAGSRLEETTVDGLRYHFAGSPPPKPPASPMVHLLQGYDEYTVGYSESKYLLAIAGQVPSSPPGRPVHNCVLVIDSQVAGAWKRSVSRDAVTVEVLPYREFNRAETAALHASADRLGGFLGLPAVVKTTAA